MQTNLPEALLATDAGKRADEILRSCVHCGFCNATCPTYQLLGDELDGPRGRIYLIKEMLESGEQDTRLNQHLDRCLTCRSCETTCPSGVEYGALLEIARSHAADDRALLRRLMVWALKFVVPYRERFRFFTALGRAFQWMLPGWLKEQIPAAAPRHHMPTVKHQRKVLLLQGCVQSVATPQVAARLAKILDARGIEAITIAEEACCGALPLHLGDEAQARQFAEQNIAAMAPLLDEVEAVICTATGCGITVQEYRQLLPENDGAKRLAELCQDASTYLAELSEPLTRALDAERVAWHAPCSLQHGQKTTNVVEPLLRGAGYELVPVRDAHLCCGSAGTYAILQKDNAQALRQRKLDALQAAKPQLIATANVGCHKHLAAAAKVPVAHWLELVE